MAHEEKALTGFACGHDVARMKGGFSQVGRVLLRCGIGGNERISFGCREGWPEENRTDHGGSTAVEWALDQSS